MPSADDVYITPASRKIEIYSGSAVHGLVSGSGGDVYVSGSGDLYLDAEGNNIVLKSAGTTFGKLNNNGSYWDFDGNGGSSYLRMIPYNGLTYWGDGTHNQIIYLRGTDSIGTNSTTLANTYLYQYDCAGNLDTLFQAGGDSYILNDLGIGTSSPSGRFNVSGGATTLDNDGGYALYFKNAGTQYGAIDTYGGSLSIEAASEAILSGASGVTLKGGSFGVLLPPLGTSAGDTTRLRFRELAANGTATVSIKAPDSIASDTQLILPATAGTDGQALVISSVTSGVMEMGWESFPVTDAMADPSAQGQGFDLMVNTGVATLIYTGVSDSRLKKNKTNFTYGLEELKQLTPKNFKFDKDAFNSAGLTYPSNDIYFDTPRVGLMADEVKTVMPDIVSKVDSDKDYETYDKDALISVLTCI